MGDSLEFQAVLLAGGMGNRMGTLPKETAKCLLPVCNKPLIAYQLELLEKAGVKSCIIVTTKSLEEKLKENLRRITQLSTLPCSVYSVEDYIGTADALRSIADKITTDFIVVSADVITNLNLLRMADVHRSQDAVATVLLNHPYVGDTKSDKKSSKKGAKDAKKVYTPECNFIGVEFDTGRMLLYQNKADVEEILSVNKWLLSKHSRMHLHSQLEDAHVYFFSHWVVDVIKRVGSISSIQGELIPWLVSSQFMSTLELEEALTPNLEDDIIGDFKGSKVTFAEDATSLLASSPQRHPSDARTILLRSRTTTTIIGDFERKEEEPSGPQKKFHNPKGLEMSSVHTPASQSAILCLAHVADKESSVCMRVNTIPAYKLANRAVASLRTPEGKQWVRTGYAKPKDTGSGKPAYNVGKDCVIGKEVVIGNKSNIKKSVVGNYSKIGDKCRISNCVLMDHVIIEDMVTLTDTVVCSNARIQSMSSLESCEVGAKFKVEPKTKAKKEALVYEDIMEDDM